MALVNKNFSDIVTFSRASGATYFDSTGTLQTAASGAPRLDFDPSTLAARGLLIEEQRTNSIRNPRLEGGGAGVWPTNVSVGGAISGITMTPTAASTEAGVYYIDVNVSGTAGASSTTFIGFEPAGQITASQNQTWTNSLFVKQVSGVFPATVQLGIRAYDSGSSLLNAYGSSALTLASSGTSLATARQTFSQLLGSATTASVRPTVEFSLVNGTAYNFTIRIGIPQCELGAFATSPILPPVGSPAQATRAADGATINALSPFFNASEGTIYAEFTPITGGSGSVGLFAFGDPSLAFGSAKTLYGALNRATNGASFNVIDAGVSQASITAGNVTATVNKLAAAYKVNDFAASLNGAAEVTDTSGTVPSPTAMSLGSLRQGWTGGANDNCFWLRKLIYYPQRKPTQPLTA